MKSFTTHPWLPDQGDGTYCNPVLQADYSDPDILRHGEDYYLIASSFTCTPGLPVLHSRDLVNWSLINHAVRNLPDSSYGQVRPGCGIWAPSLRFHAGLFWIFFPMPDEGIYVVHARHPAAEWSEPRLLQAAKGWIDPCPFWDEDGQAYLVHAYANSRAGKRDKIHVRPMAPDCSRLLGEGSVVIDAPEHPYLEGPKVHRLNGWYYIMAPGGGVPQGWQVCFRSRNIWGPYEQRIVLERGSTAINGPHQGALVDLPNGDWWFAHFQDQGAFGRVMHLQPVEWRDEWPFIGVDHDGNGVGEPVERWRKPRTGALQVPVAPATSDEFGGPALGLQWQWQANHADGWAELAGAPGRLKLLALPGAGRELRLLPHFLGQKFPARGFLVETLLDFGRLGRGSMAFLGVVGGPSAAALGVRIEPEGPVLVHWVGEHLQRLCSLQGRRLVLRVEVSADAECRFGWQGDGLSAGGVVPETFLVREGGWMGARVGLCCVGQGEGAGSASFDHFRFMPPGLVP